MEPRVTSELLVSVLRRQAEAHGGFAAILARGDSTAGSILVVLLENGGNAGILERILDRDGRYCWQQIAGQAVQNEEDSKKFLVRRQKSDPDLWLIELDVPSAERFTAEMNALV